MIKEVIHQSEVQFNLMNVVDWILFCTAIFLPKIDFTLDATPIQTEPSFLRDYMYNENSKYKHTCTENNTLLQRGCPSEAFSIPKYKICVTRGAVPVDWNTARQDCRSRLGDLIVAKCLPKFDAFQDCPLEVCGTQNAWVGYYLNTTLSPSEWMFVGSSEKQDFDPIIGGREDPINRCSVRHKTNYWMAEDCSVKRYYLCERQVLSCEPRPELLLRSRDLMYRSRVTVSCRSYVYEGGQLHILLRWKHEERVENFTAQHARVSVLDDQRAVFDTETRQCRLRSRIAATLDVEREMDGANIDCCGSNQYACHGPIALAVVYPLKSPQLQITVETKSQVHVKCTVFLRRASLSLHWVFNSTRHGLQRLVISKKGELFRIPANNSLILMAKSNPYIEEPTTTVQPKDLKVSHPAATYDLDGITMHSTLSLKNGDDLKGDTFTCFSQEDMSKTTRPLRGFAAPFRGQSYDGDTLYIGGAATVLVLSVLMCFALFTMQPFTQWTLNPFAMSASIELPPIEIPAESPYKSNLKKWDWRYYNPETPKKKVSWSDQQKYPPTRLITSYHILKSMASLKSVPSTSSSV